MSGLQILLGGPGSIALDAGLGAVAQGHQENGTLAFGVRREERSNVVVEKCQAGGTQMLRICRKVEPAADDAGFKLHGAISAIAIALQDGTQVGQKEDIGRGVRGQGLLQSEVSGLGAEISLLQTLERSAVTVKDVGSGFEALDGVDDQVDVVEL